MSRRASPTLIGLFVVGAVALLVASVLLLGGRQWLKRDQRYVVYFQESVKGLRIGAPVDFRGVPVGRVVEIRLVYQRGDGTFFVPVVVALDPGTVSMVGEPLERDEMVQMITRGLRAQLQMESLVTGQLFVALDMFPGQVTMAVGPSQQGELLQIPTVSSPWSEIKRPLETVVASFPRLVDRTSELLGEVGRLVDQTDLGQIGAAIDGVSRLASSLAEPEGPLQSALRELAPLARDLRAATAGLPPLIDELRAAAEAAKGMAKTGDAVIGGLGPGLERGAAELEKALLATRRAADAVMAVAGDLRPGVRELSAQALPALRGLIEDADRMVNNLNGAVRDMRQDPARFFFGNPAGQGVRPR